MLVCFLALLSEHLGPLSQQHLGRSVRDRAVRRCDFSPRGSPQSLSEARVEVGSLARRMCIAQTSQAKEVFVSLRASQGILVCGVNSGQRCSEEEKRCGGQVALFQVHLEFLQEAGATWAGPAPHAHNAMSFWCSLPVKIPFAWTPVSFLPRKQAAT